MGKQRVQARKIYDWLKEDVDRALNIAGGEGISALLFAEEENEGLQVIVHLDMPNALPAQGDQYTLNIEESLTLIEGGLDGMYGEIVQSNLLTILAYVIK